MLTAHRYEWHIPGTLEQVDQICAEASAILSTPELEHHIFALQLLLRETLNNAVLHGCAGLTAGRVECVLELSATAARLCVTDNGPGFNWQAILGHELTANNLESGRGLRIYQIYAHQIEFNPAGTQVTLTRRLDPRPVETD